MSEGIPKAADNHHASDSHHASGSHHSPHNPAFFSLEQSHQIERKALRYTLWGNVAITLFGIVFAVWTRSEAIFLDGLFSGIHLAISLLSLYIARLIQQPGDEDYPFGYAMLHWPKWISLTKVTCDLVQAYVFFLFHFPCRKISVKVGFKIDQKPVNWDSNPG